MHGSAHDLIEPPYCRGGSMQRDVITSPSPASPTQPLDLHLRSLGCQEFTAIKAEEPEEEHPLCQGVTISPFGLS